MILLIDNYDSFTYNLKDYFLQLGEEIQIVKNDEIDAAGLSRFTFNRIVISPGPKRPENAGNLMEIIASGHASFPILGICLGHQALGCFFGAKLKHALRPMHGKVSEIENVGSGIYTGLPAKFRVCRYHSLILDDFDHTGLQVTSRSAEGECMSFAHRELPLYGIQYHPEAILSEYGMQILANWLRLSAPSAA